MLKTLVSDCPVPNTLSMVAYDNPFSKMFEPFLVATTFMNSRRGGLRELLLKLILFQTFWHSKNFLFFTFTFPFQGAPTFRLSQAIVATKPLILSCGNLKLVLHFSDVLLAVFPLILSKNSSLRVRISPNRALWNLLLNYTLFSVRSEIARISFL